MDPIFTVLLPLIPILILLAWRRRISSSKKIPPGSLGFPIVGQTLSFLRALRNDNIGTWLEDRAKKYGPLSKLCILGKPTIIIHGLAANKFVLTASDDVLGNNYPPSVKKLLGERNLLELAGEEHRRMRDPLMSFMKPESLKQHVGKMDEEVRRHIQMHWEGKKHVKVLPLMKTLTFHVINSLLYGIERGRRSDELVNLSETFMDGILSVPINIPFTTFNRSLSASARIRDIMRNLIREKRIQLQQKSISSRNDLVTSFLSISCQDNQEVLSEDEIIDTAMFIIIAGHETSTTLLTFLIRQLAMHPNVLEGVLQEQEDIAKNKSPGELLNWEDLMKMKYSWKVAMETLRMFTPVFGSFRKTATEIEYGGYIIPQGWQVLLVTSVTHMDNSIFKEPSKFDPERFSNKAEIPSYCFLPFGAGPRMCPGNEYVRIETLVSIHYLVTRFTWKLSCKDNSVSYVPQPVPAQGLPIEVTPRARYNQSF